jgi:hypothetical protein
MSRNILITSVGHSHYLSELEVLPVRPQCASTASVLMTSSSYSYDSSKTSSSSSSRKTASASPSAAVSSGVYICKSLVNYLKHGKYICKLEVNVPDIRISY